MPHVFCIASINIFFHEPPLPTCLGSMFVCPADHSLSPLDFLLSSLWWTLRNIYCRCRLHRHHNVYPMERVEPNNRLMRRSRRPLLFHDCRVFRNGTVDCFRTRLTFMSFCTSVPPLWALEWWASQTRYISNTIPFFCYSRTLTSTKDTFALFFVAHWVNGHCPVVASRRTQLLGNSVHTWYCL